MFAPLLLLAALILPSALQQQTKTVEQHTHTKLVELGGFLDRWRDLSSNNQVATGRALGKIVAAGIEVRA